MTPPKPSHIISYHINCSVATVTAIVVAAGCATAAKDVNTAYPSPVTYQHYDCEQISAEITRVQQCSGQLAVRFDEAASKDKAIAGVGQILFWPARFALVGTKQQDAEHARLKGESDALSQAAINPRAPT